MRNWKPKGWGSGVETAMHLYVRVVVGGIADCPWVDSTGFAGRVCHWSAYRASGAVVHCNVVCFPVQYVNTTVSWYTEYRCACVH